MKKFCIIFLGVLLISVVCALKNPYAVYCEEMGYEFSINQTEGGEVGICVLPEGTEVSAWDFLKGKVATEFSYCEKNGYELIIVNDGERCSSIFSYDCAVCVKDGKATEVTKLMNLNFNEGVCGDGFCSAVDENPLSCLKDCPSGAEDYYCDGISEGICDPDCSANEDVDCLDSKLKEANIGKETFQTGGLHNNYLMIMGIVLFLGLIVFAVIMFRKLRHNK